MYRLCLSERGKHKHKTIWYLLCVASSNKNIAAARQRSQRGAYIEEKGDLLLSFARWFYSCSRVRVRWPSLHDNILPHFLMWGGGRRDFCDTCDDPRNFLCFCPVFCSSFLLFTFLLRLCITDICLLRSFYRSDQKRNIMISVSFFFFNFWLPALLLLVEWDQYATSSRSRKCLLNQYRW